MDIKKFLELSAGKWFTQRTSYHLDQRKSEQSKAEITVELLSSDNSELIKLCQQHRINPKITWGGTKVSWDNSVDWGKSKTKGSNILVLVTDSDSRDAGKLLRMRGNTSPKTTIGRYILGKDQALTLIIEDENIYLEERQWFASDNLRLRTALVKGNNGFSQTSFYSEIRKIPPKNQEIDS